MSKKKGPKKIIIDEGEISFSKEFEDNYIKDKIAYNNLKGDLYRSLEQFFNKSMGVNYYKVLPKLEKFMDTISQYKFSSVTVNLEFVDMRFKFSIECKEGDDVVFNKQMFWGMEDENGPELEA